MRLQRVLDFGLLAALAIAAASLAPASLQAAIIVNDSWADGGRGNGADAQDTNWWTSSSSAGIEVAVGSLGMVTGSSGRGIHAIFPTQTLANVGDKLIATYTFTTPATVGTPGSGAFRSGLFDTLGRAGLDADVPSSSGSPNSLYGWFSTNTAALPGYMLDMDVGAAGTEDLNFRQHDTAQTATTPTGRLMGTTTGFTSIGNGPDGVYSFTPNTSYTGSLTITRQSATELQVNATLGAASHTVTDVFDSASFGMLAFWANSATFGSSATAGTADNGIDFTNVKIEFISIPEPASAGLAAIAALAAVGRARRRMGASVSLMT